jgi:hypothetical protein
MSGSAPEDWPRDVSPISLEDLARLGINPANELFWDGKRVEVRRLLDLTRLQKTFAITVSIFAIFGAVGSFITGVNNASAFLCARDIHWLSCPAPPAK